MFGFEWPSLLMAIEFLAWHLFFGLALPFAAFGFRGGGKVAVVRIGLVASGVLRLAGLLGPAVGDLIWRLPGAVAYGVVFPLVCLMIGIVFKKRRRRWVKINTLLRESLRPLFYTIEHVADHHVVGGDYRDPTAKREAPR